MINTMLGNRLLAWGRRLRIPSWILPCVFLEVGALFWLASAISEGVTGIVAFPLLTAFGTPLMMGWLLSMRSSVQDIMESGRKEALPRIEQSKFTFGMIMLIDAFSYVSQPSGHVLMTLAAVTCTVAALSATIIGSDGTPDKRGKDAGAGPASR